MQYFLQQLAEKLYRKYQQDLSSLKIIFPNRRAGLFFRQHLARVIDKPVWAPEILSIEDFFRSLSIIQPADRLTLVFELYKVYNKFTAREEAFDKFYAWGEMLLRDFDEIDKYMVRADKLFVSLKDQKELEQQFDYLTEEQRAFLQSFWKNFNGNESSHQKYFLKIWHILYQVYSQFRSELQAKNLGYDGMIFRDVIEKLKDNNSVPHDKIVFAGFNVLTKVEEELMVWFFSNRDAEIIWDLDAFYMDDEIQEAGTFLRKHKKHKVLGLTFPEESPNLIKSNTNLEILITGVPMQVGQAKKVGEQLETLMHEKGQQWTPENTVIVLPDEQLLFPMLHSLPPALGGINVTMGYPLKNTLLYSLLEHLLDLQITAKENAKGEKIYYHEKVLAILKHPYVFQYHPATAAENIGKIENQNRVYIYANNLLRTNELYALLFKSLDDVSLVPAHFTEVLLAINQLVDKEEDLQGSLEQEYIFQIYTQVNRIRDVFFEQEVALTLPIFLKLFRQVIQSLRLPFSGEPLNGLQVMGALETRNLDFENVFILSMNEGAYPTQSASQSFVPYNIRKGFGLPTTDQQDAIYAYNFYRLLQHANRVYLYYNTEDSAEIKGEMSRFLYQLLYEPGFNALQQVLSNPVQIKPSLPIVITKTEQVMARLEKYVVQEGRKNYRLTPSAINIYLDCRLKFYYRYVAELYEIDMVQEEIDPQVFGNLLHHAMEIFYAEEIGFDNDKVIQAEDFDGIEHKVEHAVAKAFSRHYASEEAFTFQGRSFLVKEIIKKYTLGILAVDKAYAPFKIIGLEAQGEEGFTLDITIKKSGKPMTIGFKGIIDRVDRKDDLVRVIDYKTGADNCKVEDIPSLFDRDHQSRNKAAMQTIFYGLLYQEKFPQDDAMIQPGILSIKSLYKGSTEIRLDLKAENVRHINDIRPFLPAFREGFQSLVEEIFDVKVPFDQTEDASKCGYCSFNVICLRA